jgi:hypothetical protein
MMKEGREILGKYFKVFFHFYLCTYRVIEFDEARENEQTAN